MSLSYWQACTLLLLVSISQCYSWSLSWESVQNTVLDASLCTFGECCRPVHIPADINGLEKTLKDKVYGQHLVHTIVHALRSHWEHGRSKKPLTLSFHGWPGGGKNYVATFVAQHLYKNGAKSKFVHWFNGRDRFPLEAKVDQYKSELYQLIKTETSYCPKQLFVFDEVDKMPKDLLNAIKNIIDYHDNVEGVDYRQAIFIFLSNTGQDLINTKYLEFWKTGVVREDLKMSDFENLILKGAFSEKGGFHLSETIRSNLIDHYIPFLPMELKHVRLCIMDEFISRGVFNPKEKHIEDILKAQDWEEPQHDPSTGVYKVFAFFREVMEIMDWAPERERLFAKTGCKRISQKVGMLVSQHYRVQNNKMEL